MKLKNVMLNKQYQIHFTLDNNETFILDITDLLKYPAYKELNNLSVFLSASFDDDLIFWNLGCDIHIDQLLLDSHPYIKQKKESWIPVNKKSYYEYAINNWAFH
jgi:hypothetical protein